jgi:hypothetical protein
MDPERFDHLVRGVALASRRVFVRVAAAAGVGASIVASGAETEAKRKRKRKKKRRRCERCPANCCGAGQTCATAFNGVDQQCCAKALVCAGSQTGCCSPGQTCVPNISPPPGTPTHACTN